MSKMSKNLRSREVKFFSIHTVEAHSAYISAIAQIRNVHHSTLLAEYLLIFIP